MYIITENLVIREAPSKKVVEDIENANKALPEYIGGDKCIRMVFNAHPELRRRDLVGAAKILFCFVDEFPDTYEILSRASGQIVGYFKILNGKRKTPSFDIGFFPGEQRKGYGTEALFAMIEELKKNPKYTALLGMVLSPYTPYLNWIEKCGAVELKQSIPNVSLFLRVYSFPLK